MPVPKVSICLPNLNNRPFLEERMATIFAQTLSDWELIVVDNFSDDGAWELFQYYAAREPRMRISQAPRMGMYANWNNCLRQAIGEYVYIATSDDTMSPTCLQVLTNGLDQYSACDIAWCALDIIGLDGQKESASFRWEDYPSVRFMGAWMDKVHFRPAPHDGLLAFALQCPYTSMTQVLLRRTALSKTGLFSTEFGPFADLEWQMRAGLLCDSIYFPQHLATWRVYAGQGSSCGYEDAWRQGLFMRMGEAALTHVNITQNQAYNRLNPRVLMAFYRTRTLYARLAACGNFYQKAVTGLQCLFTQPVPVAQHLWRSLCQKHNQYDEQISELLGNEIKQLKAGPREGSTRCH